MKAALRYTFTSVLILLFLGGACTGWWFVHKKSAGKVCHGFNIMIAGPENGFVSEEEVLAFIEKDFGHLIGRRLDSLKLGAMEKMLESKSAILRSEAWITPDGILNITATQRRPLVRFLKGNGGYYADSSCFLFPLHASYTAPVLTVAGDIPIQASSGYKGEAGSVEEKEWIEKVLAMAEEISSSDWADRLDSIHIDRKGVGSFPLDSNVTIIFGPVEKTTEKLKRLTTFENKILGRDGYRTVDLTYDGQIICRK